jgi:hypothetical protein
MLLLGLEVLLLRSEKNDTLTVCMEIHKGETFLLPHINENLPQALSNKISIKFSCFINSQTVCLGLCSYFVFIRQFSIIYFLEFIAHYSYCKKFDETAEIFIGT